MSTIAKWIWQGEPTEPNVWMRFRKHFYVDDIPQSCVLRIAVDSKYWLWINGAIVVREGQLKRGPTPVDTYVDNVDIAQYLKPGENDIAVLVWYWGVDGSSHMSSGSSGLLVDGIVASGGDWKASRHPGYQPSTIKPIRPGTIILSEWDAWYDARLVEDTDWTAPDFDDAGWGNADELGVEGGRPWGRLADRPIPFWRDSGLVSFANASELDLAGRGSADIAGQLPANIQVTPYFKIDAPVGCLVTVQIERDWEDDSLHDTRGVQEFEVLAWGNGHNVTFSAPVEVKFLEVGYRESGYPSEVVGAFECDDPDLNLLWKKSVRTADVCMRDSYMDCPDRERSQWPNDAVNIIDQTLYAFDRQSDLLTKKLWAELLGWRTDGGILWGAVPCGRFRGDYRELYCITLSTLGPGVGEYYRQTGDLKSLSKLYPAMRDYLLDHYVVDSEVLLHPRASWKTEWGPGTSNWHDWGDQVNLDHRLLENVFYFYALKSACKLAEDTGDLDGAKRLAARIELYIESFDSLFWRGDHYRAWDYAGLPDDRGNAIAVVAGLASRDKWPALLDVLHVNHFASICLEKYIVEALYIMGEPDIAMARIKRRLAHALQSSYTTLPEAFDEDSNHGWSGWPVYIAGKYIAGVCPLDPGYKRYKIAPQLGSLTFVNCKVQTVRGNIEVHAALSGSEYSIGVDANFMGAVIVELPASIASGGGLKLSRVFVDGVQIPANQGQIAIIEIETMRSSIKGIYE